MRERIRKIVASARRLEQGRLAGLDARTDAPSRLAAEAVRLAQLAVSVHLAEIERLSRQPASESAQRAEAGS